MQLFLSLRPSTFCSGNVPLVRFTVSLRFFRHRIVIVIQTLLYLRPSVSPLLCFHSRSTLLQHMRQKQLFCMWSISWYVVTFSGPSFFCLALPLTVQHERFIKLLFMKNRSALPFGITFLVWEEIVIHWTSLHNVNLLSSSLVKPPFWQNVWKFVYVFVRAVETF